MSFPRYPSYKDSGVEWLGKVPGHWEVTTLYGSVLERTESNKGMREDNLLSLSYGRIVQKDIASNDGLLPESFETYQIVRPGDIVFRLTDLQNDKRSLRSALVEETGIITSAYLAVTPRGASSYYMSYLFRAFDTTKVFYSMGGGLRQSMKFADLKRMPTLLPPLPEQTQIAAFLDRETAKIDALVTEQRRLMELLKEKRQAVISHAVTRGLNPDAPLKPSGIAWLGDVPAHWEVLPLKRIVSAPITDGPHETPNFIDEGVPFVSAEAVSSGSINFSKVRAYISEEDNARYSLKYAPKLHDIYMVKSGATTGVTAIVEDRIDFNIWSPLAAIRCNEGSVPHFVLNFMRSKHFQEAVTLNWSFGTQQNIGMGVIENLACTVPPLSEQRQIAQILKIESAKFDTLTAEAQRAVDLLQERRITLISAAVTGQIDVRELSAMEPQ
jgi:type I restriction enzyme S subunit